jgi:hypothetical protein
VNSNSTDPKEIRKFGFIALFFFGFLCGLGLWMKKPLPTYLFGFLSLLGLGFVLAPSWMRPLYVFLLKISHFIGRVVTTLILILAYYLVITPTALIKRMAGGVPLPTKPNKKVSSYWVNRADAAQPKERFLKRY